MRLVRDGNKASKADDWIAEELAWCRNVDLAALDDGSSAVVISLPEDMASQSPCFLRSIVDDK